MSTADSSRLAHMALFAWLQLLRPQRLRKTNKSLSIKLLRPLHFGGRKQFFSKVTGAFSLIFKCHECYCSDDTYIALTLGMVFIA